MENLIFKKKIKGKSLIKGYKRFRCVTQTTGSKKRVFEFRLMEYKIKEQISLFDLKNVQWFMGLTAYK